MGEKSLSRIPFTMEDEEKLRGLAQWMQIAGGVSIASGVLEMLSVPLTGNLGALLGGPLSVLLGVWLIQGAAKFKLVADTDVADQEYLVDGISSLRKVFLLQGILLLIGLGILAIALMLLVVVVAAGGG